MRDYILLIMALILFIPVFIVGHLIHMYKELKQRKFSMRNYAFTVAKSIDKTGGAMLFNVDNRTISAMVYEKQMFWAIDFIDWIFRQDRHCFLAWREEFGIE